MTCLDVVFCHCRGWSRRVSLGSLHLALIVFWLCPTYTSSHSHRIWYALVGHSKLISPSCVSITHWHCCTRICLGVLCERNSLALLCRYMSQRVVWVQLTGTAILVYVSAYCMCITHWHCYTSICLMLCVHNSLALLYRYMSQCVVWA